MALSIINVAKHSLKFSSVQFIVSLISLPVSIYVATVLVPEEYGIVGFLGLWSMYAGLIGPGISSAGAREIPVLLGKGEEKEALRIQNVSITPEMLYSVIPFIVILGASFFYSDPVLKIGLIIIAVSYVTAHLVNLWSQINFIREKFNTVATGNLIVGIASPVIILLGVYWLKIYALLIAPFLANVILWIYYLKKGAINFHFEFDRSETIRLLRVGVILQGLALIFWAFRLADRTIIASMLSFEQLGLYIYAIGFITMALMIPRNFTNVLQPILWKEASKADSALEGFKDAKKIAIYLAIGTAILIPTAQLGFYLIVNLITTRYIGSIPIFYVLSYNLYLASIVVIPNLVLGSSIVNKQKIVLCSYSIALALNIIFDILVIKLGYGVVGVAWVTICTQGLVTFMLYLFIKGYIFNDAKEFIRFQLRILFPFLITILFYFFHEYLGLLAPNVWTFVGISLATQVILWSLLFGVFYRGYLSISDIKAVMREMKAVVKDGRLFKKADK